jgi:hypothetical protein
MAITWPRFRRQRDPFAGTPAAPVAPLPAPAAAEVPHGIATPQTLAALYEQARTEQAQGRPAPSAAPWGPWDHPGSFPAAMEPDALRDEHGRWYGWDITAMDVPPAHTRQYVPDPLTAPVPARPVSFAADFRELPVFRAAVRTAGHAPAGRVRAGGGPALPDFRISELMHARFAGMLAMHVRTGVTA